MDPQERFEQFTAALDKNATLPREYVTAAQHERGLSIDAIFRENWNELANIGWIAEQIGVFRALLAAALERGQEREPAEHHVLVHGDWLMGQIHNNVARRSVVAISEVLEKVDSPVFLTAPGMGPDLDNSVGRCLFQYSSERAVPTLVQPNFSGLLSLENLGKFLDITRGYHPEDKFRLYGGEWHACLTAVASQLAALSIGKWWPYPGNGGAFSSQSAIVALAGDMSSIPVRFGVAVDELQAAQAFMAGDDRLHKRVSLKFNDERTQLIF